MIILDVFDIISSEESLKCFLYKLICLGRRRKSNDGVVRND